MDELRIRGGTLVTMDGAGGAGSVLDGDLRSRAGAITKVGGRSRAAVETTLDARGCLVLPGLVMTHLHLCQALFRGMADDLPLLPWLKKRIWPLEAAHDARSMRASAELGLAEMLKAGVTTILDMGSVAHQEQVFRAMARSGIRGFSGKAMMDAGAGVPRGLREKTKDSLAQSHALAERWHGKGRLGYAYAPRFILSCTERLFREVAEAARGTGRLVHSHVAEHADERIAVKEILGQDDVAALASWGVAGPQTVLAHGVQLRAAEMKRMARAGTRVAHCPSANLKLASGIADVVAMRAHGMVVGIGPDGAPCNNRMDPWTELRSAALLSKARRLDAASLPAAEALELATIEGARVLGWQDRIGSLEVGKRMDAVVVRQDGLHQIPGGDPYSRLVYATRAEDVRHVVIDGQVIVRDGELLTLDEERVRRAALREGRKTLARADTR